MTCTLDALFVLKRHSTGKTPCVGSRGACCLSVLFLSNHLVSSLYLCFIQRAGGIGKWAIECRKRDALGGPWLSGRQIQLLRHDRGVLLVSYSMKIVAPQCKVACGRPLFQPTVPCVPAYRYRIQEVDPNPEREQAASASHVGLFSNSSITPVPDVGKRGRRGAAPGAGKL